MTTKTFTCSDGCTICGVKKSTSNFKPWTRRFREDDCCMIFHLDTMNGRRGLTCNPCILYIRRSIRAMTSPNYDGKDFSKRLDCKASPSARRERRNHAAAATYDYPINKKCLKGYKARHRITPRYVYTGRRHLSRKSTDQLIPKGPYEDPEQMLEDGDDIDIDLPFYRSVTMTRERTMEKKKADEKRKKEKEYLDALLGSPSKVIDLSKSRLDEKKKQQQQEQQQKKSQQTQKRKVKRSLFSRKKARQTERSVANEPSSVTNNSSEDSQDRSRGAGAEAEVPGQSAKKSASPSPGSPKSADSGNSQSGVASTSSEKTSELGANGQKPFNRRFPRIPVRNRPIRNVSMMDCSYWQKFTFCCMTMYVGENGHVVINVSSRFPDCKKRKIHMARLKEEQEARRSIKESGKERLEEETEESQFQEGERLEEDLDNKQKRVFTGRAPHLPA